MEHIIIGAKVINKSNEIGVIKSFEKKCFLVEFENRTTKFRLAAFEVGYLKYENEELQNKLIEYIKNNSIKKSESEPQEVASESNENQYKTPIIRTNDNTNKITIRLDKAPITFYHVRAKDKESIQKIFDECDKDTSSLYQSFCPIMEYPKYSSWARSKYCAGFLTKYLDTFVFRVFSRNDIYKKRKKTGFAIIESDTTEILRVVRIGNNTYYFSKNISLSNGFFNNNSKSYNNWHISDLGTWVILAKVIRKCDCGYLNDYIVEHKINCNQYLKLMFPALYDNKVEIVFKNKLYLSTWRINDLSEYLKEFSPRQIDFASKNDVINTLPVIKSFGLYDVNILRDLEKLMKKREHSESIYNRLEYIFKELNFDCSNLYRRVVDFLRRIDLLEPSLYLDYINMLHYINGITSGDFFDKDYIIRHNELMNTRRVRYDNNCRAQYAETIKELLWIDRKVDEYFIIVPKTIEEYKFEGDLQHNCVYSARYFMDVINKISIIVFLRKEKNTPFVTIEFDYKTFEVLQAYGKFNSKLNPSLYKYIVDLGKTLVYERMTHQ